MPDDDPRKFEHLPVLPRLSPFGSGTGRSTAANITPLHVEGKTRHPDEGGAREYSVVLTIRDDEGNEVAHQVVGIGAMHAGKECTFGLAVEVVPTNDVHKPGETRNAALMASTTVSTRFAAFIAR